MKAAAASAIPATTVMDKQLALVDSVVDVIVAAVAAAVEAMSLATAVVVMDSAVAAEKIFKCV